MKKMIFISLFLLNFVFQSFCQTIKRDSVLFNDADIIEIKSNNSNAQIFEILARDLVSQGYMFEDYNKDFFYLKTKLERPFGKLNEQQIYIFVENSVARIQGGLKSLTYGYKAQYLTKNNTIYSKMFLEMITMSQRVSKKLDSAKIYFCYYID
jgi:hypothetical protein